MFTSSADVFRTRQSVSDLTAYISSAGRSALGRITSDCSGEAFLGHVLDGHCGCFDFPGHRQAYGEVLLAAALPDDDFPAFTCATALLLLDRISNGSGEDDLYWNWDAFSDHYRLADPAIRATIMNAFRIGAEIGCVSVSCLPDPSDCLTLGREQVMRGLGKTGNWEIFKAIEKEVSADDAGRLWTGLAHHPTTSEALAGFRYLFERSVSLAPEAPESVPTIPWSL